MRRLNYLVVASPEAEQLMALPHVLGLFLTRLEDGDLRATGLTWLPGARLLVIMDDIFQVRDHFPVSVLIDGIHIHSLFF